MNQQAWSTGWIPTSPIRPREVALFRRQLSAFSCSGLGEADRQLVFLCHCALAITVVAKAPVRTNGNRKSRCLSDRFCKPAWKAKCFAALAASAISLWLGVGVAMITALMSLLSRIVL